jgi:hypothetical protein
MKNKFVIYGSNDSFDSNVMVFVDKIPDPKKAKKMCEEMEQELSTCFAVLEFPKKNVKVNLGVMGFGVLEDVFEGFPEEMNNVLFETYKYHLYEKQRQTHHLDISEKIRFSLGKKLNYVIDKILYMLSESDRKEEVVSLSDLKQKILFLRKLNLNQEIIFEPKDEARFCLDYKKDQYKEFLNYVAQGCGQSILLHSNLELYTKAEIWENLPELRPFMEREYGDLEDLNSIKNEFIDICQTYFKKSLTS